MNSSVADKILKITGSKEVAATELLQKLWSNYGELLRVHLKGGPIASVILKHIHLPVDSHHPKGFDTNLSQQRKLKSYEVETNWYENFNHINLKEAGSPTAKKLASFQKDGEFFILLEDLIGLGYSEKLSTTSFDEIKVVLSWLASFHAKFMTTSHEGLWNCGTYWHLDTRPDELEKLASEDSKLWQVAGLIDKKLRSTKYQTLVHGDAKLDNFCFSKDRSRVAAVDFQYVGRGCGMKDVAYFIGSCLTEDDCEKLESDILDFYFSELEEKLKDSSIDKQTLEMEWRALYPFAWADFHRFLKGWSPGHWKINSYSDAICEKVRTDIFEELLSTAQEASIKAGQLVKERWQKDFKVSTKAGSTESSKILTEVDLESQELILSTLKPCIETFDLGLLAEEDRDDGSRLNKSYFWAIDPLDGTLPFSEGQPGFAISIALVNRHGNTLLGVVYDPVGETLYHAIEGEGSFKNKQKFSVKSETDTQPMTLFADRSLKQSPQYSEIEKAFDVKFSGGAVMNTINALLHPNACYFKFPKEDEGGCAIWDLAAVQCLVSEAGGVMTDWFGQALSFNNPETVFSNKKGLIVTSNEEVYKVVKSF